ncbi:TPA: cache domain-containing protein, partial [Campylobacter jejuni]|nr:cache domain-containing protein [Campylobacter jejuni]
MNSIKIKLSFIANLIAIIALIALGIISFYFTRASLHQAVLENQTSLLKMAQSTIEDFASGRITFTENLAKEITSLPLNAIDSEEGLIKNTGPLLKAYRHSSDALAIYIGQSSGENIVSDESSDKLKTDITINGKANGYDATQRPWYQDAKNSDSVIRGASYVDAVSKQYVRTYSKALYKDGKFIGVLGVDVLLSAFQGQIERIPGNILLFNRRGVIFTATNKQLLDPSVDHTSILNAYKANGDYNFFTYKRDGEERLGICTKIITMTACATESAEV